MQTKFGLFLCNGQFNFSKGTLKVIKEKKMVTTLNLDITDYLDLRCDRYRVDYCLPVSFEALSEKSFSKPN